MKINEAGLKLVKQFEGLRLQAYRCPAGVWTIGYGHTLKAFPGEVITEQQAEALLLEDLEDAEKHRYRRRHSPAYGQPIQRVGELYVQRRGACASAKHAAQGAERRKLQAGSR